MSWLDDLINANRLEDDDGEGELYEVRNVLGTNEKPDERKEKVKSLLSTWYREYEQYGYKKTAPTFSLEIHALNDDSTDRKKVSNDPLGDNAVIDNPMDGYGTYVFIPESMRESTTSVLGNIFATPIDVPDDFDVLKVLARTYTGEYEQDDPPISTRELSLARPEYYPLAEWNSKSPIDPMNELLAIFDRLQKGEFAGVMLSCRMADPSWKYEGNARMREIEDPNYIAHPKMWQRVVNAFQEGDSKKVMGGRVDRLAGYEKQALDVNEKAEMLAIQEKQQMDTFRCTLRVYASRESIADAICDMLRQRTSGQYNRLQIVSTRCRLDDLAHRTIGKTSFVLSSDEIASIWHVPDDNNMAFTKMHKAQPQISTPPESLVIVPNGGDGDIKMLLKDYLRKQIQPQSSTRTMDRL